MLRSTFVTAVSISIILLGLYILFSALLSQRGSFEQSYHIGCYLDNQVNDHYFQIKQAIEQLAIKEDQRLSKLSMYRSAVLADNSFDRKAYEVARKFQSFVKKQSANWGQVQNSEELQAALLEAEQQYSSCRWKINEGFDQKTCVEASQKCQKCFKNLSNLSLTIKTLSDQREKLDLLINKSFTPGSGPTDPWATALEKAEKNYRLKLHEIEAKKQKYLFDRSAYETARKNNESWMAEERAQLSYLNQNYRKCRENRRQFIKCQQLSKEVKTLGSNSLQALQNLQKSKSVYLKSLKDVLEKEQDKSGMEEVRKMFLKGQEELKSLMKMLIEIRIQIQKYCGCSEDQEKDLQELIARIERNITRATTEIASISISIAGCDKLIESEEQKRKQADLQYQEAVKNLKKPQHIEPENQLLQYKLQLEQTNAQISELKDKYISEQQSCRAAKEQMSLQLKEVNAMWNCLSRKNYFLKLQQKTAGYRQPGGYKDMDGAKEALRQSLQQFAEL